MKLTRTSPFRLDPELRTHVRRYYTYQFLVNYFIFCPIYREAFEEGLIVIFLVMFEMTFRSHHLLHLQTQTFH